MKQVSDIETKEILRLAEDCLAFNGDFVELGCFEGDTSLLLAELLRDKKTFSEIEEVTGMSSATIARINRCLQYGADGYSLVLDRMEE